jgi:hypothetical protein
VCRKYKVWGGTRRVQNKGSRHSHAFIYLPDIYCNKYLILNSQLSRSFEHEIENNSSPITKMSTNTEKPPLLPIANANTSSTTKTQEQQRQQLPPPQSPADLHPTTLLYISLTLLTLILILLNIVYLLPPSSPFYNYTLLVASGIQTSAWAALPAPIILFIYAPYLVEKGRVLQIRCLTFLFYLVGTLIGALMFGLDLREVVVVHMVVES